MWHALSRVNRRFSDAELRRLHSVTVDLAEAADYHPAREALSAHGATGQVASLSWAIDGEATRPCKLARARTIR